ncbi:type IV pili methyl-accepting chemotaxis transducer N-terminal domain-containing protein [Salmonella enterica subsp. enterica serovar Reading]|nr:type IV pili methyl-accepting chemotaxis transducer N-terminal domain-containing protein [Salmonella enterica subsp. enterica serovar Reading]
MFKRCFSPLTLVNQLALIVMLSTAIGVAGMAVSGWLVQGVQGSAHAINKAGSLRMQSYRLLAAVPLDAKDQKLLDEMEQTAFSLELTRAAERDGQQKQLKALQDYWHNELSPGLQHAQNAHAVAEDVTRFVAGLDRLVTSFDHTTELRIERVVLVHRVMAIFMALLLVFTIIWLLSQIRNELNCSWAQLRELLTTFRLQLTEPGLRPALEASCQEFSARFGFTVKLDYQLPPRLVPSHQAIHLLQIAREALSNALKHSHADDVVVTVTQCGKQVKLKVQDNGCGVPENAERSNHYGMIIMRDRAQSLRGDCQVRRRETGGTEVTVTFIPETNFTETQGDTHE